MSRNSKIIIFFVSLFLATLLGLVIWYFYTLNTNPDINNFEDFQNVYIFGQPPVSTTILSGGTATTTQPGIVEETELPRLRKISTAPVSGFFTSGDVVRYVDRASGNVYEASTKSSVIKRITNTTIPRVQNVVWIDKNSLIIQYFDDNENIKSFYAEIVEPQEGEESGKLEGVFLPNNAKELTSLGSQIFYLLEQPTSSIGIISNPDGSGSEQIFSSPLKEWLVQRFRQGSLSLTTKASYNVIGFNYLLNTLTGNMYLALGDVVGLTTLFDHSGDKILISESYRGATNLSVYDLKQKELNRTPLRTLPEKCVWALDDVNLYCGLPESMNGANYPDIWYQGLLTFNDNIYHIDTDKNQYDIIASPMDLAREDIDVINPRLGDDEKFLFFMNKKDYSLWSLEI